jgi:hypothetical protein
MSIIDLKNDDKLTKEIFNSIDTKKNLKISFDNEVDKIINLFFDDIKKYYDVKNQNVKNYYIMSNGYSYEIDLLEYPIKNNFEIYLWLINCIEIANNLINHEFNQYIKLYGTNINIWKISICQNIMFNYPFTLEDVIFLPIDYIIEEFNLNRNKKIIITLIHEKIHIAQRFNEIIWEKFIQQNNNWKKINSNQVEFNLINSNIFLNKNLLEDENIFIFNPDTLYNNFKYIWTNDGQKFYYGNYILNIKNKKINKKYFELDLINNKLIPSNIELEEEHPFEYYAYKLSEELYKYL